MKPTILTTLVFVSGIFVSGHAVGGATALAAGAGHRVLEPAAHSGRPIQALPLALRPALYQALAQDAGATYTVNKDGCATLAKQGLKACFDAHGAHFTNATPLSLHLVAFGRGGKLSPVGAVRPAIHGNRVSYAHGALTAWWRVLPMGFEQGFTIAKRPSGHGALTLALTASRQGAGAPLIRHSREGGNPVRKSIPTAGRDTSSHWIPASAGMTNNAAPGKTKKENGKALAWGKLRYGKLAVTDANGQLVPATLTSKGGHILITVNDAHAVYPLTVDPLVWIEQKVMGGDSQPWRPRFGASVAVSGNTALIGEPTARVNGHAYQGEAYVFTETNGIWTQTAKLTASDGADYDYFGTAVALDGTRILVGALEYLEGPGAAYVFTETNGTWTQKAKLTASDGEFNDQFGNSVALDGATALVGAYCAPSNGAIQCGPGAVYVFSDSNGSWVQTVELGASDGNPGDHFGYSVALAGTTALIGATHASVNGHTQQGAAYVFTESGSSWSQTQKLFANDGAPGDAFGYSVALDGTTAVIGAPYANIAENPYQGTAYVFAKAGGAWSQMQKLIASGGQPVNFGLSVALNGSTVVIGAPGTYVGGHPGQGAAYVFSDSNGPWVQTAKLTANDGYAEEQFGRAAAISGTTALVGVPYADNQQGAAYFYGGSDLGLAVSAPHTVGQGQQYVSQTIAANDSSTASPAVTATIAVPVATNFIAATATQGSCSETYGMVTCDFGQIPGNAGRAMANVTLKATGSAGTTIENTASIAKATPALTASAATEIMSPASCPAGYIGFSGHLDAGGTFTSAPITVAESSQKYVDFTAPASFAFFATITSRYGTHTYVYRHVKHGHRWGPAGTYQVGVQAGATGGDYTLCVNLNPAQ